MGQIPGLITGDLPGVVARAVTEVAVGLGAPVDGHPGRRPAWSNPSDDEVLGALVELGDLRLSRHDLAIEQGAVYTPLGDARRLVGLCSPGTGATVCDPAVGSGVFLLAAAEHLLAQGDEPTAVVDRLLGADIDPVAVALTRAVLGLWSWWRSGEVVIPHGVVQADALIDTPWPPVDVVVGNPPFLGQLRDRTARSPERTAALVDRYGTAAQGYVDESALFVLAGCRWVKPGGRVCLVLPRSVAGARAALGVRTEVARTAPMTACWLGGREVFPTVSVDVFAPVFEAGAAVGPVAMVDRAGERLGSAPAPGAEWNVALAAADGIPTVRVAGRSVVGDMAEVGADFRDAYYWLAKRVVDEPPLPDSSVGGAPRVLTVGLVDPLWDRHGAVPARLGRRSWRAPVAVVPADDDPAVVAWVIRRTRPKVVVATQTRVVECVVDLDGDVVPCTPLISVVPAEPGRLWHLAAALSSPVVSALAAAQGAGTGLGAGTFRLRAAQVADLPLPEDMGAWDRAAVLARELHRRGSDPAPGPERWEEFGIEVCRAYGVDDPGMVRWWLDRLPRR